MKVIEIKSTKELPSWFSISKYSQLKKLDEEQVINQLRGRILILQDPNFSNLDIRNGRSGDLLQDHLNWNDIKESGLINYNSSDIPTLPSSRKPLKYDRLPDGKSIEHITTLGAITHGKISKLIYERYLGDNFFDFSLRSFDIEKKNIELKIDENNLLETNEILSPKVNLAIHLNYPDNLILEELSSLLSIYREKLNIQEPTSTFNKLKVSKIINYRLLPYIDLKLWEKSYNVSITYSVFAAALFPDGYRGQDFIRTSLQDLFTAVSAENFFSEWEQTT